MGLLNIDAVLSPIAREMSHRADDILDLREAAITRNDPGRCLSCYYRLLSNSRHSSVESTTPLRHWLEQHLEIVAKDKGLNELERLPVRLDSDSIEVYCKEIISVFRHDRDYQHIPNIELSFQFKGEANSVA